MRTIDEIYKSIITEKESISELSVLDSPSKSAIWRLWTYITAVAIWGLEKNFEQHKTEIETYIQNEKAHTPQWYRTKVLAFQYGFPLITDTDQFDNTGYSDEQIEASKIIKYAAVNESDTESRLIIKVATETGDKLSPITTEQQEGLYSYISNHLRDAGVRITLINYLPDKLKFQLRVKRDPNILDSSGTSIINGNNPVKDAIEDYMKHLPFDGELLLNKFVDILQSVPGVIDPNILMIQTAWIDPVAGTYGSYENITFSVIPESGYFEIDWENTEINYVV